MTLDEAIANRRSVRAFLPRKVPDQTIREVFELAQRAPSNCNVQPWISHVVSGGSLNALGRKLVKAANAGIAPTPDFTADRKFRGAYRERQIDAAVQLYGAMGIERHDRPRRDWAFRRNLQFFDAPHAAFVFMFDEFEEREAVDLGIYAQTLLLAFTSRGIGTCAQGALGLYPSIIRDHLGIDASHRIIFGISFGYEDVAAPANATRVGRVPLDISVVFHQ